MRPAPTLALVLTLATLAGCFGGAEVPDARRFQATGGAVTPGWAYDGVGLAAGAATLDGQLSDGTNTGIVNVTFVYGGATYVVTFDQFAQGEGKTFQDGGIEFEIDEHGDTGVADASIPTIHALIAAWGAARVTKDGALATPEPWTAHLMLSADTVRGADGKILKTDSTEAYDPANPANARRLTQDPQALFFIKHPQGETFSRGGVPVGANLTCAAPQCSTSGEIPFEVGAKSIDLNITYEPGANIPLTVGRATLTIVDAAGTAVFEGSEVTLTPAGGPAPTPLTLEPGALVGPLTATVTGDGSFTVRVEGTVTYDDQPFLVVTWDEPIVEDVTG